MEPLYIIEKKSFYNGEKMFKKWLHAMKCFLDHFQNMFVTITLEFIVCIQNGTNVEKPF